jgi:hypothetical protein
VTPEAQPATTSAAETVAAVDAASPPVADPPCPLFARLFESGRRFEYRFSDVVDTHATAGDGPPTLRTLEALICTVSAVEQDGAALRASVACRSAAGTTIILDVDGFRYRDGGLWWGAFGHSGEEAWLSCSPRARSYTLPGPAGDPGCSIAIARDTDLGWCRTERCPKRGYGYRPSIHTTCVAAGRGLTLQTGFNLEGPRTTEWRLVKSQSADP